MKNRLIHIFFSFWLIGILVCIAHIWYVEEKKDKEIWKDYEKLQSAKEKMSNREAWKEADEIMSNLLQKYPESFWMHFLYGAMLVTKGDLIKGEFHLHKARKINIFVVFNISYLIKMSECYLKLGKLYEAEQYAIRAKNKIKKDQKQHIVDNLLHAIFIQRKKSKS